MTYEARTNCYVPSYTLARSQELLVTSKVRLRPERVKHVFSVNLGSESGSSGLKATFLPVMCSFHIRIRGYIHTIMMYNDNYLRFSICCPKENNNPQNHDHFTLNTISIS